MLQVPELEHRLSELQAQIDRLTLSLHLWRQTQERLQPMERRLSQLTDQCAEILNQWTASGERHAHAVGELEARLTHWSSAETRVQEEASSRFRDLERTIEQEWSTLRQLHEEPVKQLSEQAATLTEVCIAAAGNAQRGFDRAEARLAALESDLHTRMTDLTKELREVAAELRARPEPPLGIGGAQTTWPLEGVVRLHDQLRQQPDQRAISLLPASPQALISSRPVTHEGPLPMVPPEESSPLVERLQTLERAVNLGQTEFRQAASQTEQANRLWRVVATLILLGFVVLGAFAWRLQLQAAAAAARAADAQRQAKLATEAATQRITATRDDAARQIADAKQTARKAQIVADVLAAPDLVRYNLIGGVAAIRASGQVLWSRSRGLVFSGSRLAAVPQSSAYQVWLLTAAGAVSAGLVVPDASGRAMLATDTPPSAAGPVVGIMVTLERSGGSKLPSGEPVLARAQAP